MPLNQIKQIEAWAGVECTLNRVGRNYFDQLRRSGHAARIEDLDLIRELNPARLRYPLLWEKAAPDGNLSKADWSWADERFERLHELNIKPIAGLVHHGSGPAHTSLLDDNFAEGLAEFAYAAAKRFPWIEDYTPVNEPLTTARFSCLYGHWYPHARDDASFAQAFVNECKGIALAMRAVRSVNPKARLIQTEDWGTAFSTPMLAYQTQWENTRRWLTYDLLCGRIHPNHPCWARLREGVSEADLEFFIHNPCPPDIVGINYYITSDRFLDENLENYPEHSHGGNGRDRYADIESVRVADAGIAGHAAALYSAWDRYHLPVAITEVHIDSTREDQLRWLREAWEGAYAAQKKGADVRAVTSWALLGSHDWNSLVTRESGYYESGLFDIRTGNGKPRPTALAKLFKNYSSSETFDHAVLQGEGWWRRPCRAMDGLTRSHHELQHCHFSKSKESPVLITGGRGTLGRAFARACESRALSYRLLTRDQMDIADSKSVEEVFEKYKPWALVNAAGYVKVDEAEYDADRCFRENTLGAANLAQACAAKKIPLLTFSTDLIFGGEKNTPYVESDVPAPLSVYGRSKAEAEKLVLQSHAGALVVRTSSFFGPWDDYNFLTQALKRWSEGAVVEIHNGHIITPTYVPDLVRVCLDLLIDGEKGVWHLASPDAVSWIEFAERLAKIMGYPSALICEKNEVRPARRPAYSALGSERGILLPPLQNCIERYVRERDMENARLSFAR